MIEIVGAKDIRQIGDALLILGDCVEVVPHLEQPVDMIFCDPAYELTKGGVTPADGKMGGKFSEESYENDGEIVTCLYPWATWLPTVLAVLPVRKDVYLMTNDRHVAECQEVAAACDVHLHRLIAWDKGRPTPGRWGMQSLEFINYLYRKPARLANNKSLPQVIKCAAPRSDKAGHELHPTEKPPGLIEVFIQNSTSKAETVLDPMMGSASTGVAALNCGRKFIGIEYERKHFELACKRIEAAVAQPSLLGAAE